MNIMAVIKDPEQHHWNVISTISGRVPRRNGGPQVPVP